MKYFNFMANYYGDCPLENEEILYFFDPDSDKIQIEKDDPSIPCDKFLNYLITGSPEGKR